MEEMEGADGQVLSHLGTHRWLALHTACLLDDVTIVTSSATSRTRGHVTRTYLESRGFAKGGLREARGWPQEDSERTTRAEAGPRTTFRGGYNAQYEYGVAGSKRGTPSQCAWPPRQRA